MHATRVLLPVRLRWAAPLAGLLVSSGMVDMFESRVGITPFGCTACLDLSRHKQGSANCLAEGAPNPELELQMSRIVSHQALQSRIRTAESDLEEPDAIMD
jgi:hypothetical protein